MDERATFKDQKEIIGSVPFKVMLAEKSYWYQNRFPP